MENIGNNTTNNTTNNNNNNDELESLRDTQSIVTNDYEGDGEDESVFIGSSTEFLNSSFSSQIASNSTTAHTNKNLQNIIRPAVFRGPPKLLNGGNLKKSTSDGIHSSLSSSSETRNGRRLYSMDENLESSSGGSVRVPIHSLSQLKPAFSINVNSKITPSSTNGKATSMVHNEDDEEYEDGRETPEPRSESMSDIRSIDSYSLIKPTGPLSQFEIDLLVKLEEENTTLQQQQVTKQPSIQSLRPLQIPSSRTDYLQDVFSSTQNSKSGSPTREISSSIESVVPDNLAELEQDADWEFWGKLLNDFENTLKKSNKTLIKKIQNGLPKAVRGTIWNYFSRHHPLSFLKSIVHPDHDSNISVVSSQSGSGNTNHNNNNSNSPTSANYKNDRFLPPEAFRTGALEDAYVELLKLSSPYEKMIIRDLSRTFPKHDFFKHADGLGQESLFNVMKAYSLYDSEVGYCQGLSFIVGALLLNMPDEQAFSCLSHLMHTYQFRGMFTPQMELLQLRLYQFDKLLQELLPKVNDHLLDQGVRSTMYASQWFLTLFSYRFPLEFVFRVLDIIFSIGVVPGASGAEGGMMDGFMERVSEGVAAVSGSSAQSTKSTEIGTESSMVLFRFAFALLKKNEEMLLALEFEPLLEFLKHGLFEIYVGTAENDLPSSPPALAMTMMTDTTNTSKSHYKLLPRQAIDDLVKDACSNQFKALNKKRMLQIRREYEDELRKSDPTYLAEKSLEAQNQRLVNDLKRAEKMLAELNKDHCDLAGQLISMRIDLAKQKEIEEALIRQITDLKQILGNEVTRYEKNELEQVLKHVVTADNAKSPLPIATPGPLPENKRLPSIEEQVEILTRQNLKLVEEIQFWQMKAEAIEKQMKDHKGTTTSPALTSLNGESVSTWTKRLFNRSPILPQPTSPPVPLTSSEPNSNSNSQSTNASAVSPL